jgi:hypothetical protein
MFVSNEAVGSVIGRRGAKINEIRAMSGARINVLESGTKGRGGGGRGGSPEPDRERIIGKLTPLPAVLRIRSRIFLGLLDPDGRYGSGSGCFYHQAKLVRKILNPIYSTVLRILYDIYLSKNDVNVGSFKKYLISKKT